MDATVTVFPSYQQTSYEGQTVSREARQAETAALFAKISAASSDSERAELQAAVAALNVPLATSLAARYHDRGESDADLRQVACLGLMKAVHRFDPTHGASFGSFAIPTILGELKRHFRDHCWAVRPTRELQEYQATLAAGSARFAQRTGREPTVGELADELQAKRKLVEEALVARRGYMSRSLDSESTEPWLASDDVDLTAVEDHATLAPLISRLGERDREVIRLRFYEDKTQAEISQVVGVSQMQVSRILRRIFDTLRDQLAS